MKFTEWLWNELGVSLAEFDNMTERHQRKLIQDYLNSSTC